MVGSSAALLSALRPRQWTKNLILFAGLIFAKRYHDGHSWAAAVAIFGAYCAASSAAYLVNDVRDAEHDRKHPTKRFRPIARGDLAPRTALGAAAALLVAGLGVAAVLNPISVAYLAGFAGVQTLYSLLLKRIVLIDVLTIAGLFVLRAAAGAAAVEVHISVWLLVCTALLAFFLGLAKRRAELVLMSTDQTPGRPVLQRYSIAMLDRLVVATALAVVAVYAAYAYTVKSSHVMLVTVPFVFAGVTRYLHLIRRRDLGEEPEQLLVTDPVILGSVACWAIAAVIALAAS